MSTTTRSAYVVGENMVRPPSVMRNLDSTGYSEERPSKTALAADTSNARWCASALEHLPSETAFMKILMFFKLLL